MTGQMRWHVCCDDCEALPVPVAIADGTVVGLPSIKKKSKRVIAQRDSFSV